MTDSSCGQTMSGNLHFALLTSLDIATKVQHFCHSLLRK